MWHARLLQPRSEVPREHPADYPTQDVANNKSAHPAVRLLKGDQASDPDSFKHFGGHICIG